jgi:hypothetical protein
MQPTALRGASDVNSRTGDRRPRPRALCCTKCSCRPIRFFGYSGVGQPCRPRPRPHTYHSFGLSTGSHGGDRVAAPIGGSARVLPSLLITYGRGSPQRA